MIKVILNIVMKAEWSNYLQVKVYECTEDLKGHDNGDLTW